MNSNSTASSTVTSKSAIATLTTESFILSNDLLFRLIIGCASPFQLSIKVTKTKKKASSSPASSTLECCDGGTILTCRNVILRSLCGESLLFALDAAPFYYLGGHTGVGNNGNGNGCGSSAALALAGISSWMSVADSIRSSSSSNSDKSNDEWMKLVTGLNQHLSNRSFLVESGSVTLADLDVYFALLPICSTLISNEDDSNDYYKMWMHLWRWMDVCQDAVSRMSQRMMENVSKRTSKGGVVEHLQPIVTQRLFANSNAKTPIFYYPSHSSDGSNVTTTVNRAAPPPTHKMNNVDQKVASVQKSNKKDDNNKKVTKEDNTKEQQSPPKEEDNTKEQQPPPQTQQKQKKEKKPKKKAAPVVPQQELDITALDIRVGLIVKAWSHPDSEKLYCEEIDLGETNSEKEPQYRSIASGLRAHYASSDLIEKKKVLVLCNLKSRNLGGFPSHGMVLCASNDDHTKVELVRPPEGATIGERVVFDGYYTEGGDGAVPQVVIAPPAPDNRMAKKKIFEKLAPDLKTDMDGNVVWKNAICRTLGGEKGICRAENGMVNGKVS